MDIKPQIITEQYTGRHNSNLKKAENRLLEGKAYRDLSTICIVPTRGQIPAKVVQSWMGLMIPMNQKFTRMFMIGMEVGEAYQTAVEHIISHPDLSKWKYILTLEEDNMPLPDSLIRIYQGMDKYDAVGALYWTKGEGGQPMIYGDPHSIPTNFVPQIPIENTIQPCNGLGMGFTLFKTSIFKDKKLEKPWFKTVQKFDSKGAVAYTQDLYFFEKIKMLGYKVACDTSVKVGHYDINQDIVW